jgi:hypothetical protein
MVSHTWNWIDFGRHGEGVTAAIESAAPKAICHEDFKAGQVR